MKAKRLPLSFLLAGAAMLILPSPTHYISRSYASSGLPPALRVQSSVISGSTGVYTVGTSHQKSIATVTVDCAGQGTSNSPHITYEGMVPYEVTAPHEGATDPEGTGSAPQPLLNSYIFLLVGEDTTLQSSQTEKYDRYCGIDETPLPEAPDRIRIDFIRQTFPANGQAPIK